MMTFILRRLLSALLVVFGVTLVTFALFHFVGGDPALLYAGKNASAEVIASLRQELGLDQPMALQYLQFVKQTALFDWGQSWSTKRDVTQMITDGVGASLSLTLPAYILSVIISLALSLLSVYWKNSWVEKTITTLCLASLSVSFLVYIIYAQKILAFDLNFFPVYGWDPSWQNRWTYITLPSLIYCLASAAPKILLFRTALINEVHQDYVRTAVAKGLGQRRIYSLHILKNAALPILTLITSQMPTLITGSLLLEAYFGIPGLGGMLIKAIHGSDLPVIKALTVLGSLVYILFNLLNDVIASWLNARVELP